jgi:hypothetical protein
MNMRNVRLAFAASIIATISVLPISAYADGYVYSYTGLPFTANGSPFPIGGSVDVNLVSNGPIDNTPILSNSYLTGANFSSWTITVGQETISSSNPLYVLSVQMDIYSKAVFDWNISVTGPYGGSSGSLYYEQISTLGNIFGVGNDYMLTAPYVRNAWTYVSEGGNNNKVGSWTVTAVAVPSPVAGGGLLTLFAIAPFLWLKRRRKSWPPAIAGSGEHASLKTSQF